MLKFSPMKIASIVLICLLGIAYAMPNALSPSEREAFPSWAPNQTVQLGLDLQGGAYLLLEVGLKEYIAEQMEILESDVRKALRKDRITYRNLRSDINGVRFVLRKETDEDKLVSLLRETIDRIDVSIDERNVSVVYMEQRLEEMRQNVISQSIEIVRRRVDQMGTTEPVIARHGNDRILLEVPGISDSAQLKRLLGKTARLTFHLVNEEASMAGDKRTISLDSIIRKTEEKPDSPAQEYVLYKRALLTGEMLEHANLSFSNGQPAVSFRFNTAGGRRFGELTKANVGRLFAIVLDGTILTAPVIREPILGGSGIISGQFTSEEANELAILLRAGALPAPLKVLEERTVGPSLGQDSIAAGKNAALLGLALVVVMMVIYYGVFGFFANISLLLNMIFILSLLSILQATLTLPGIAGIVLTMGMAVDANVLIFERIREEIKLGMTPMAAIERGFKQAFSTIIDANITTLIAAIILFLVGSGPVKGFAVTLAIGIMTSMFSAITLTRFMISRWLFWKRPTALPI